MDLTMIVATHKEYRLPQDEIYMPVHAGRRMKRLQANQDIHDNSLLFDWQGDDTGDNISLKNPNYCELTCLYWGWKNLNCDFLGLVHYRRHFKGKSGGSKWDNILSKAQAKEILDKYTVILPKKRNYYIETTYNQYINAHNRQDLDISFDIIKEDYPEYIDSWNKVMRSTSGHRFNMFIMRKDMLDSYCKWLFDILFKLETRLDISNYSEYNQRVFGFVSERMLDVWILANNVEYYELPVIHMEKVNWPKKIVKFLTRKFVRKK